MGLKFWKYEGAGNDFIMLDGRGDNRELRADTIARLCDRHRGIGADGLIIMLAQPGYDFRMRYFNADGGEVDMCGNGGRCIVLFADELGIGGDRKRFMGRDGEHSAAIVSRGEDGATIELGMIEVNGYEYSDHAFILNTGVPHYVEFVDNVDALDVFALGREKRQEERFDEGGGVNVNFAEVLGDGYIKVRTYERGVENETLACGTGVTAAAIATRLFAQADRDRFTVETRGGTLEVRFATADNQNFSDIFLTGPARRVFEGEINM